MNPKNSKEVIYSIHNIKSYLSGVKKICPKRKSGDITGTKFCLDKSNSNEGTADTNHKYSLNVPKEKKICIKFKDLVADKEEENDENNLELALLIKKRRYTGNQKKIYKCNNKINLGNDKEKDNNETNDKCLKISKSMGKIIIDDKNENSMIKKFKRKILCCYS